MIIFPEEGPRVGMAGRPARAVAMIRARGRALQTPVLSSDVGLETLVEISTVLDWSTETPVDS